MVLVAVSVHLGIFAVVALLFVLVHSDFLGVADAVVETFLACDLGFATSVGTAVFVAVFAVVFVVRCFLVAVSILDGDRLLRYLVG